VAGVVTISLTFEKSFEKHSDVLVKYLDLSAKRRSGGLVIHGDMKTAIVTIAESLIPMIIELRHTTENDRRIAPPIVSELVVPRIIGQLFRLVKAYGFVMKFRVDQRRVLFQSFQIAAVPGN
jgi:hypothetical protein